MALLYLVIVLLLIVAARDGTPEKGFSISQVLACSKLNH
jgi:hypothetical protein